MVARSPFDRVGFLGATLTLLLASCSDDGGEPPRDGGPMGDALLFSCKEPGLACNAHNPCAINPVCGEDLLCHPERYLDCDDGLECTVDNCGESGQCLNAPKEGFCSLLVKDPGGGPSEMRCLTAGAVSAADPCLVCDPARNGRKWSGRNGGECDDGNPCTKADYCKDGSCAGTYYGSECADGLDCTADVCDGKGDCSNALKSGQCLIAGACWKDQEPDPTGCSICDAQTSTSAWTPLSSFCKIGPRCYAPGVKDSSGCGVCDPPQSTSSWSPAPGTCHIDGGCYTKGAQDPTGCGSCDPTSSASAWTPTAGKCLIAGACYPTGASSASGCATCNPQKSSTTWSPLASTATQTFGFEAGLSPFTVDLPVSGVGWQVSSKRSRTGTSSLYFGNPASSTYGAASATKGKASVALPALPAGKKSALQLWLYLDVEASPAHDLLRVSVGGTTLWSKSLPPESYREWVQLELDLSVYAGQSPTVVFEFDSVDAWANDGEGVYLDEIVLLTGC